MKGRQVSQCDTAQTLRYRRCRVALGWILRLNFVQQFLVKAGKRLFGSPVQIKQLPGTNEKNGIGALGWDCIAIKTNDWKFAELVV